MKKINEALIKKSTALKKINISFDIDRSVQLRRFNERELDIIGTFFRKLQHPPYLITNKYREVANDIVMKTCQDSILVYFSKTNTANDFYKRASWENEDNTLIEIQFFSKGYNLYFLKDCNYDTKFRRNMNLEKLLEDNRYDIEKYFKFT